jgi:hypothetical protein
MATNGISYYSARNLRQLPDWTAEQGNTFLRTGDSLMIVSDEGTIVIVRGYFTNTVATKLMTVSGKPVSTVPDSFHNTNSINGFRGMFGLNKAII